MFERRLATASQYAPLFVTHRAKQGVLRAAAVLFIFGVTALARAQTVPPNGVAETAQAQPAPQAPDGEVAHPPASPPTPESKTARVRWTRSKPSASEPDSLEADEPEPQEAQVGSKAHLHDGLYLRVAFGPGYLKASTEKGSELSGWGFSPEFWMGASPIAGLALGGTLGIVAVPNPQAAITAADSGGVGAVSGEAGGVATYSAWGVFADYYPNPRGGLHMMAGLNFSSFKFTTDSGEESQPATGLGLFGGIGYEWWAGRQWSVGPLVRLHWASVSDDHGTTSILSPVFMLGITNH